MRRKLELWEVKELEQFVKNKRRPKWLDDSVSQKEFERIRQWADLLVALSEGETMAEAKRRARLSIDNDRIKSVVKMWTRNRDKGWGHVLLRKPRTGVIESVCKALIRDRGKWEAKSQVELAHDYCADNKMKFYEDAKYKAKMVGRMRSAFRRWEIRGIKVGGIFVIGGPQPPKWNWPE